MKKLFLILGILFLSLSIDIVFHNIDENNKAAEQSQQIIKELNKIKTSPASNASQKTPEEPILTNEPKPETEMKTAVINNLPIIGTLEIPAIKKTLPVINDYSDQALKQSPCRYSGSIFTDDLIIAGHNYKSHFAKLYTLKKNDFIYFQDIDQNEYSYIVSEVSTIPENDIDAMFSGDWDLTLFTCAWDNASRVTIRCVRTNT